MKVSPRSLLSRFFAISLTTWIFVSMIVGILVGYFAPQVGLNLKPFSQIFMKMIKSLIAPLIFSTLVVGIAGHGDDVKRIGKLALKSLVYFEVATTLALGIGLAAVNIMKPGVGIDLSSASSDQGQEFSKTEVSWQTELLHIFPQSFFEAASKNEVLQIVVCAVFFAIGIMQLPNKHLKKTMIDFNESLSHIMFKVTNVVMKYAPIGIGCAMAYTIAHSGIEIIKNLALLIGTLYAALLVYMFLVLLPFALYFKVPIRRFLKHIKTPALIAFSTTSSDAALPRAMEELEELGCPKEIIAFVMPTGYSFNMDGTTLYLAIAAVFAAQAGGVDMPIGQQVVMMLTLMITSKGVAAVPRASLVILSGTLSSFGLPLEAIAVILGVDEVMDMARTTINLVGNCLATVIMSISEGEFGKEKDLDLSGHLGEAKEEEAEVEAEAKV